MSLIDLAALLIQAPGGEGLTPQEAERTLLEALLGHGDWAGLAPSRLAIFCCWGVGFLDVDDEVSSFTWCGGKTLRESELLWLWSRHIEGASLTDVGPSPGPLRAAGLLVKRDDALSAFGIASREGQDHQNSSEPVLVVLPGALRSRKPGDAWTDEQRAALLEHFTALKSADVRLTSDAVLLQLGQVFCCSASNLKQQLAKARKVAQQPAGSLRHAA